MVSGADGDGLLCCEPDRLRVDPLRSIFRVVRRFYRYRCLHPAVLFAIPLCLLAGRAARGETPAAAHLADPAAVVALQPARRAESISIPSEPGRERRVTLTNLNPLINSWYLLQLEVESGRVESYHLENPAPERQRLRLIESYSDGLVIDGRNAKSRCALWSTAAKPGLEEARASQRSYAPLCKGALFLRNPIPGRKTNQEKVTDFLRDNVWSGERITVFVRNTFFQDAFAVQGELVPSDESDAPPGTQGGRLPNRGAPLRARVDPRFERSSLFASELGIRLEGSASRKLMVGRWYRTAASPHVFVSAIRPSVVSAETLASHRERVNPLDPVEGAALAYLIAFDLKQYDLAFELGTEHPRVVWSDRMLPQMRDPALPGPDGLGTLAPLVMTGKVPPFELPRIVATVTGGFKRRHGAFKYGVLALRHRASHYGFLEQGVVLSRLQSGLATVYVLEDGWVGMKTWDEEDARLEPRLRHARQNGVPLIEWDEALQVGVPGPLVNRWSPGNWSGSQDSGLLRALRAGFCLQETPEKRFLIYGYFSTATPSAMARVFQAYGCRYAMHLDMNALEHTYLALYQPGPAGLEVQHLIQGMEVLDLESNGQRIPRFVGYADNRDFFYLLGRETGEGEKSR